MKSVHQLIEGIDTPFYLYSESKIKKNIKNLTNCFTGERYHILYAMKANANPSIIKIIVAHGFGVDVCSIEEIMLAVACGIPYQNIYYNSDCITEREIDFAVQNHVHITVGSVDAINYLLRNHPGISISLRINSGVGAGHSENVITNGDLSKFGISISDVQHVVLLCKNANIIIEGIHSHTGSGELLTDKYIENAKVLFELSRLFPDLLFINFGGGFGFDYKDGTEYDISTIYFWLEEMSDDYHISKKIKFIIEPGRYVIVDAGKLIARACSVKENNSRKYIGLDTGYNHFPRCFYYNAWHNISNISSSNKDSTLYDITGYLCQSGDVFARDREIIKTEVGDLLCINDVGAYGYSMSSNFNLRIKPAEYLISDDGFIKMIRRAETFEDVLITCKMDL